MTGKIDFLYVGWILYFVFCSDMAHIGVLKFRQAFKKVNKEATKLNLLPKTDFPKKSKRIFPICFSRIFRGNDFNTIE